MDVAESSRTKGIPATPLLVDHSNVAMCAMRQTIISSYEETVGVCGDCKFLLLEDFGSPSHHHHGFGRRRRRRRRSIPMNDISGSESVIENQFTVTTSDDDGPRVWRRMLSDTESSGAFYDSDSSISLYGESESNVSFRIIHGDSSDAIFGGGESDDLSLLETYMLFLRSLDRSELDSNTDDIDPMHVGSINWSWEERGGGNVELEESWYSYHYYSPLRVNEIRRWRTREEGSLSRRTGGFENFWLQQESGAWEMPAPAAKSYVNCLPLVVIKNGRDDDDGAASSSMCAICKEIFLVGSQVLRLPCIHLYHPSCILPWLSMRNSCPLCRYELPTDDLEDFLRKLNNNNNDGNNNSSVSNQHHQGMILMVMAHLMGLMLEFENKKSLSIKSS